MYGCRAEYVCTCILLRYGIALLQVPLYDAHRGLQSDADGFLEDCGESVIFA